MIRVNVTSRSSIFKVALAFILSLIRNSDRAASVTNPISKLVDTPSLVMPCQSLFIMCSININMFLDILAQSFNSLYDLFIASFLTHALTTKVSVTA
jgi:hypothetical protein